MSEPIGINGSVDSNTIVASASGEIRTNPAVIPNLTTVNTFPNDGDQFSMGNTDASKFRLGGYAKASGVYNTLLTGSDFAHYYFEHNFSLTATGAVSTPDDATSSSYVVMFTDNGLHTAYQAPSGATVVLNATPTFILDIINGTLVMNSYVSAIGGLRVKEVANGKQGSVALTGGSAVVSNTSVTANSRIFLTSQVDGGSPGFLRVSTRTVGTSFTITSSNGADTSTVAWQIFEPA